jgi:hypothetical protein
VSPPERGAPGDLVQELAEPLELERLDGWASKPVAVWARLDVRVPCEGDPAHRGAGQSLADPAGHSVAVETGQSDADDRDRGLLSERVSDRPVALGRLRNGIPT